MADVSSPRRDPTWLERIVSAIRRFRLRIGALTLRTIVRTAAKALLVFAVLLGVGLFAAVHVPAMQTQDLETYEPVHYLNQGDGWDDSLTADARQTYYYTPQGAGLKNIRYRWFINLELPWGQTRIADPNHIRPYGFIVDPRTPKNPDQLPVGFTKHFDAQLNEEMLDITCAACHTGQLNVTRNGKTTSIRIDGGQAMHAFTAASLGHFVPTLMASMTSTLVNPFKFNRFAHKVLEDRYDEGYWTLHAELRGVLRNLVAIGLHERLTHLYPTEEGFGRTDALGRIANTVFAENLDPANYRKGTGPVSYPPLWNIWKFDWVQYNASVSQPMARNIGESMGVGAKYALVDRYGRALPPEQRFRSTALVDNLYTIELALWKLQPPAWPSEYLGAVDARKAERGKALFNEHCVGCHGPFVASAAAKARTAPLKGDSSPVWMIKTVCLDDIGTDPNTAMNFYNATVDITRTGLTAGTLREVARKSWDADKEREAAYLRGEIARLKMDRGPGARLTSTVIASENHAERVKALEARLAGLDARNSGELSKIDPKKLSVGAALSYLGTMIREKAYGDLQFTKEERDQHDGFGALDLPQVIRAYKPRPLAGIWATPPYLHNGSVPTIYDLLSPASERPATFMVGSREFDPVKVGLVIKTDRGSRLDTSKSGNSNRGHEFNHGYQEYREDSPPQKGIIGPYLTPDERMAIIEHLKIRDDDRDGPQEPREYEWTTCPRSEGSYAKPGSQARLQ